MSAENFTEDIKHNMPLALAQTMSRVQSLEGLHTEYKSDLREYSRTTEKQFDDIKGILDIIKYNATNCPHLKIEETEAMLKSVNSRIDRVLIGFVLSYGGLITTVFFALRK